jgi:signal transduction histidine kinase
MTQRPPSVAPNSVAIEMYRKNLELTERNKMLSLLRKIDEIVLGAVADTHEVAEKIAQTTAIDTNFGVVAIYQLDKRKNELLPVAVSNKSDKLSGSESDQAFHQAIMRIPGGSSKDPLARALKQKFIVQIENLTEIKSLRISGRMAAEIQAGLEIKTWFVCPLNARDQLLGVMLVGLHEPAREVSTSQKMLLERLIGAVGIAIDNTLLYRGLQEATRRLRTANRHLKELDEAKDEFISMASHQLRTPLTSIKGYISMLAEGDAGKLQPQQKEFLDYAYGGSQRMVNLINDLLNVSRMQAGKFMIEKSAVDITAVVKNEVDQLQSHARAKNLQLNFIAPKPKLPLVKLDEGKTRQVIMNFIDNAIYYTQSGSITVTLQLDGRDFVKLEVTDTGIGVPMDSQRHLFGKFFRAENAKTMRPDGTGLGLYLAKRVIEDQGGTIIFRSIEGNGSTFGFRLPIKSR